MPLLGESLSFTLNLEVDVVIVSMLSMTSYIAKSKDGLLYAVHLFSNEEDANQMNEQFKKVRSLNILKGYILARSADKYVLAAALPPKMMCWKTWLIGTQLPKWRLMYRPFVVIPEEVKSVIRKISQVLSAVHQVQLCHGSVIQSLMIGPDNSVLLIPRAREQTVARIQYDLDDYKEIMNEIFQRIPGGVNKTKFQIDVFNELCSLEGAYLEEYGPRSKRTFSRLILACPLNWEWKEHARFMAMVSIVKAFDKKAFKNIFLMNAHPAELRSWRKRLPGREDITPLYSVYNFMQAPAEYKKRTGFVEYRKNFESHARDYEPGIMPERVEDIFYFRFPDLVFKLYYLIVLETSSDSTSTPSDVTPQLQGVLSAMTHDGTI